MNILRYLFVSLLSLSAACSTNMSTSSTSEEQLIRLNYNSAVDNIERDAYVYLPRGYDDHPARQWPVMIYLHGDGERGDGKQDLDYVMGYGPLYEAWVQKKEMPFILIVPQLHMFGRDGPDGPSYIRNRTPENIPKRQADGTPPHNEDMPARDWFGPMKGAVAVEPPEQKKYTTGWSRTDPDIISILDIVSKDYRADADRVYMSGASAGAFGLFHYASRYPDRFAALLPVVGYPTIEQAEAVAEAKIPIWIFSGGRDPAVKTERFFHGMNRMDELGATIRFTTEQDMFHDVWNRVYAGDDVYNWLLSHRKHRG